MTIDANYADLIAVEEKKIRERKRTENLTGEQRKLWRSLGNRKWKGVMPKALTTSWSRHQHAFWAEHAQNETFPAWFRVMAFAFGSDKTNGHINVPAGELTKWLGVDKSVTGRAIKFAVEHGLLGEGSSPRCLVLPGREKIVGTNVLAESPIWGGTDGNPFGKCQVCHV
ncbi:hypothetical protein [Mycobacterium sp. 1165178.9]|uniref:hypothetical protein n=1 Tax=Mycobacterium sp. 1165178.9 TaxID=1834070 RepID=UPI000802024A|nr:hypothetical protein [Mycobacterium sp. 1165178.9]OBK80344.1 hypothetical protein A5652_18115 [Mycobacterium sp. 1165178.9]